MAAYPLTESDANNAQRWASRFVIGPNHYQAPPAAATAKIWLHKAISEDRVYIDAPFDSKLSELFRRVPGQFWDWQNRQRNIPASGLKRFVLDLYNDPDLESRYWPLEAPPDLAAEIAAIIEESEAGEAIRKTSPIQPPAWLTHNGFSLRNYQHQASQWLASQRRAMLAFDMGLGKTVIALTALKLLRKKMPEAKAIVVCPAGIKNVWKNEIQKFTDFSFELVDGTKEQRIQAYAKDVDILVMGYELLSIDEPYIHQRVNRSDCLIVDEASYLRNECQRTKAFREIVGLATYCWLLTGTPFMNNLKELYNLVSLLDSSLLDSWWVFEGRYLKPDYMGQETQPLKGLRALHDRLSPIMFRKRKDEIAEELPEKIFEEVRVPLSDEQKTAYNQIRERLLINLAKESSNPKWLQVTNALAEMTRLKQVCDSLKLLDLPEMENPKIEELKRLLNEDLQEEKVIVFTQYEKMAKILERELKEFKPVRLSGSVPADLRESLVNQFQADPDNKVFITTGAGGMGLTLTAASVVIFYDVLFNPKMMDQIIGRADRIGNAHKSILVLNLIAEDSIEAKILELTKSKSSLFDAVMENDAAETAFAKLTPDGVAKLVGTQLPCS